MKMCAYVFGKINFEVNFIHQNDVMVSKKLIIKYSSIRRAHLFLYCQPNKRRKQNYRHIKYHI